MTRVEVYWIPLGAGGSGFVRLNGRIYEWFKAGLDRRARLDLYHTALQVHTTRGRFVVETMWPRPDRDFASRGVVFSGPVFSPPMARLRVFQYEVRVWRDGILPDAGEAIGGPQLVSTSLDQAEAILESAHQLPNLVWGRDQIRSGEMWNSNSVISWLLARAGMRMDSIQPPSGGRAPGWAAGLTAAGYDTDDRRTDHEARGTVRGSREVPSDVSARSEGQPTVGRPTSSERETT